ncbi:MAG: PadR family transcriptional regulator [Pseudanabaenaceae cyanobacterium bins.39]|nr:PadR family transcriptional regulator [Pseudanabaenaceae cyanobacterium bins.39]
MSLAYALLVSLIHDPKSGYDLAKQFDGSVGFFWQATHQQIYRELTKLEQQELIEARVIAQESRPDKKIFSVTDQGLVNLKTWLLQSSDLAAVKDEFLVKIYAGYLVPREAIIKQIQDHRQLHQQQLAVYEEIENKFFSGFSELRLGSGSALAMQAESESQARSQSKYIFAYLTLRRGMGFEQGWIDWCNEALSLLKLV